MEYCCTQTRLASNWEGSTDCTGSTGWSSYHILHTAVAENEKDEQFHEQITAPK